MQIQLPNEWTPRDYQMPALSARDEGCLRLLNIWHRRSGKDTTALNQTAKEVFKRVGGYWHLFPEQSQARKAIWNGINKQGRRIIDQVFPHEIRARTLDQEMLIEFINGSFWQLVGSDRYDSLVGSNPVGAIFTEYALSDPRAWDYVRPILSENDGWAWFITTPRGKNHAWQMYQMALRNPDWYADLLTVEDTGYPLEKVEEERRGGMSDSQIAQEFYCSFEESNENQLIQQEAIDAARARTVPPMGPKYMGVDIARFGDDSTTVCMRDGDRCKWVIGWQKADLMQTVGRVAKLINQHKPAQVSVDDIGVGAGVTDRLRQLGYRINGVGAGAKAIDDHLYYNKRAEMWSRMGEWLRERGDIPADNNVLATDLAMQEYEYDASNRIKLIKKQDMKKKGLPSPDYGDALALTFAQPVAHPDVIAQQQMQNPQQRRQTMANPFGSLYR